MTFQKVISTVKTIKRGAIFLGRLLGSLYLQGPSHGKGVCVLAQSFVSYSAILWTIAHQALLSMGFSRQEYRSGLPCPPPGGLPNPGIEPVSLVSPALGGGLFITSATWEGHSLTPKRASHWPWLVRIIKPCQTFLGLLWFLN